jgi:tRNA/rRNA methyltransferase
MAGTDDRRRAVTGGPAIILMEPQLGENIGTAARAMMNCGLDDLRLVRPRDGWPSDKAIAAASSTDAVLARARLYPSLPAAIGDLVHVYAATARDRGMVRREVTPRHAAEEMRARLDAGEACGVGANRPSQRRHSARRYGVDRAAQPRLLVAEPRPGRPDRRL